MNKYHDRWPHEPTTLAPTTPDPTTPPPVSLGCGCINKESLICDYETTEPDCYFIDDNTEWSEKCCI